MAGVNSSRGIRLALAALLLAGATVRIWGMGFGLPLTRAHPDEPLVAHTAVDIAGGHLDPGFFNYPTVFMYDRLLARTDSRVLAGEWLKSEVADGASVYLAGGTYGSPDLSTRGAAPPYRMWEFDEVRGRFDTPSGLTPDWPDWIIVQESPLTDYSHIPKARAW